MLKIKSLPVIVILTLSLYSAGFATITGTFGPETIVVLYLAWLIAAASLFKKSAKYSTRGKKDQSLIKIGMNLFVASFSLSTMLVGLSGIRPDFQDMARQTLMLLYTTIAFYALYSVSKHMNIERAMMNSCHAIATIVGISIFLDFSGLTSFETYNGRNFGFLGDAGPWALTLPLIVYLSSKKYLFAAISSLIIAMTLSRGATIISAGAIIIFFTLGSARIRSRDYIYMAVLFSVVLYFSEDQILNLIERFTSVNFSSNDRTATSANGINIFFNSPIFGNGYNSLSHFYSTNYAHINADGFAIAASTFVQVLSDGGLITFTGFFCFICAMTYSGIKSMRKGILTQEHVLVSGLTSWTISMVWLNHSATWLLANSFLTPIIFGCAGLIAGYASRVKSINLSAKYKHENALYVK